MLALPDAGFFYERVRLKMSRGVSGPRDAGGAIPPSSGTGPSRGLLPRGRESRPGAGLFLKPHARSFDVRHVHVASNE